MKRFIQGYIDECKLYFYQSALTVALLGATGVVGDLLATIIVSGELGWFLNTSFSLFFGGLFLILLYNIWRKD